MVPNQHETGYGFSTLGTPKFKNMRFSHIKSLFLNQMTFMTTKFSQHQIYLKDLVLLVNQVPSVESCKMSKPFDYRLIGRIKNLIMYVKDLCKRL